MHIIGYFVLSKSGLFQASSPRLFEASSPRLGVTKKSGLFNFYFIITKYWFEVSKLQTAQLFDNQPLTLKISLRSTIKRTRCWSVSDLQPISGSLFGQPQRVGSFRRPKPRPSPETHLNYAETTLPVVRVSPTSNQYLGGLLSQPESS